MAGQFLNYTNLTYNEIVKQVRDRLREDPEKRFDNFLESSVAQTMIEIFAASTDLTNYYLERRAEEQFLDTARLKSSVIQLSKILGYVIQRAVPAESSAKIVLKGPLPSGINTGDFVEFPQYNTTFTYNGNPFILKKTYRYTFTADDIAQGTSNTFEKEISVSVPNGSNLVLNAAGLVPTSATQPIQILQGEIKQKTFTGSSNTQVGETFQKYDIDDTTFSNIFGTEDLGYSSTTETFVLTADLTKVAITTTATDITTALADEDSLYEIDRRSILTSQTVLDQTSVSAAVPKVCSIRTKANQGVEILFGDNIIADKGVNSSNQNLYVQYFSTKGLEANVTGVIDKKLTTSNSFTTNLGVPVTDNLEWRFNSNVIGGADLESVDAIKLNAPGLFYSLDRLVTSKDYVTFLKSLTSPVNIKNALAWGEQEEVDENPNLGAIQALFNVVFYSCIGSLYNINSGLTPTHSYKDLLSSDASAEDKISTVLEGTEYDVGGTTFAEQNYFNIYIKNDPVSYLDNIQTTTATGVTNVNNKIKKRSQLTLRNAYITPIIQQFNLTGNVYVKNLVSINDIQRRINNALYEYLNENADFATPIYLSNMTEIIESFPEVIYADPSFTPVSGVGVPITTLSTDQNINNANWTASEQTAIAAQFTTSFVNFAETRAPGVDGNLYKSVVENANSSVFDVAIWNEFNLPSPPYDQPAGIDWVSEVDAKLRVAGLTERNFYEKFMKHFYDNISVTSYKTSNDFKELFARSKQQLKAILRSGMKDEKGNIVNYSFKHEIAQVISNLTYTYRG